MTNTWKVIVNGVQIRLVNNFANETKLYINGKRSQLTQSEFGNRTNYIAQVGKLGALIISKVKTSMGNELRLYQKNKGTQHLLMSSTI